MDPINYNIDVASPLDSAMKGYQAGLMLTEQRDALQAKQQQRQQQGQMTQDVIGLSSNPNPSAKDYAAIMTKYPQLADHFKKAWDVLDSGQQKTKLEQSGRIFAAMQSNPEVAATIFDGMAAAAENSGNKQEAQANKGFAELVRQQPALARALAGIQFGAIAGIDKLTAAQAAIGEEGRKQDLHMTSVIKAGAEADTAASESVIRGVQAENATQAAQADLDAKRAQVRASDSQIADRIENRRIERDRLETETALKLREMDQKGSTIPEDARKLVNTVSQSAISKIGNADKSADLADRIEAKLKQSGGLPTRGMSATLRALGMEGEQQALQQEYSRLRNSNIMANLPSAFSASFSNTDRQFVEKGIPEESANPQYIAGFLRSMEKVLRTEAAADRAAADWVSKVHSMAETPKDMEIGGISVPKGSSFADYATMITRKTRASSKQNDALKPYEKYITK